METERVTVDGREIRLLGVCQGLEGESEALVEELEAQPPAVVALALDPDVAGRIDEVSPAEVLGAEDEAYMKGLSEWGSVRLPAETYPAAVEAAERIDARVEGVDMGRAEYLDRHIEGVGTFEMLKRALRTRWLAWWPPKADTPAAFCRAFDERINAGPFQRLQAARERFMADNLARIEGQPVAFVVEVERLDGVSEALRARSGPDR